MKKILLVFLFYTNFSSAVINEYVSDVYFANGIDTSFGKSEKARDKIKDNFELSNPEAYNSVNDWQVSYNHTHGIVE
ncbi:hypothetical protein MNB_SV-3-64 [hydrothermal vent metagenome]|uniref:Uncharacterized protein n=1 Tax=hydrothermal vent metagenome TaxID=652676 RepID=A0A1W1BNX2_9ZZZZ